MNQVTEVQVPLNMGAAAHKRAGLVDFFFPLPLTNSGAFWFQFNTPQSLLVHALTLGFLSITDNHFSFVFWKDGTGNAMSVVLRISTNKYTSTARDYLQSIAHTSAEVSAAHIHYSRLTDDEVSVHSQHMEKNEN